MKHRPETIEKMKLKAIERFRNKENHPMFGKHFSEETKRKISIAHRGRKLTQEWKEKVGKTIKERWQNPEFREKMSLQRKQLWQNPEFREKMLSSRKTNNNYSIGVKNYWKIRKSNPEEYKKWCDKNSESKKIMWKKWRKDTEFLRKKAEKFSKKRRGIPLSWHNDPIKMASFVKKRKKYLIGRKRPEHSELLKKMWENPKYKEKVVNATMKAQHRKPNQKEIILGDIIKSVSPDYIFVGDGGKFSNVEPTVINGRVPDFINVNGQKKAINFNGTYWHLQMKQKDNPNLTKEQVEEMEKEPYKKLGWDLLIIWEDELKDRKIVMEKIQEFQNSLVGL